MKDQAEGLRSLVDDRDGRATVLAVTSGKGGVGKTNICANLAIALASLGKSVVIVDVDIGLANADVVLGVKPAYDLRHVLVGQVPLRLALTDGPGGVRLLAGSAGAPTVSDLDESQRGFLVSCFEELTLSNDFVLIDTGATVDGYFSDITRSYVFGEPNKRQREVWNLEKAAQAAAFSAAKVGAPAESVDRAARDVIEAAGFGPGYQVPGLAHRTGHGIGLDIHEETYIVPGNTTALLPGMCFSNEPMICIYGEFGVRLEDHVYITEDGPRWFTQPSPSIDQPFA